MASNKSWRCILLRKNVILFLVVIALSLALILTALPVFAQLITSNQKMKIVKVEKGKNRLQCRVHEGDNQNVQYVLIDKNTRFSTNYRIISHNRAWSLLKTDTIIRVKGGVTWEGHIKARQIYW